MKTRKLALELDSLAVDSFATDEGDGGRGTVRANDARADEALEAAGNCTCRNTCVCPTAYYLCGTGPESINSCDYTMNRSCVYA